MRNLCTIPLRTSAVCDEEADEAKAEPDATAVVFAAFCLYSPRLKDVRNDKDVCYGK